VSARAIAAVAVVAMLACNYRKVSVPLTTPEATTCAETCRTRYGLSRHTAYMSCLEYCPGAQASDTACGDDERPPVATCVDDGRLKGPAAVAVGVGLIVFVAAAAIGLALSAGADTIDDDPP
jgi:hypothetical protein